MVLFGFVLLALMMNHLPNKGHCQTGSGGFVLAILGLNTVFDPEAEPQAQTRREAQRRGGSMQRERGRRGMTLRLSSGRAGNYGKVGFVLAILMCWVVCALGLGLLWRVFYR
jgi:small neutral amino acid transporter SnatA (MarC family)